MLVSEDGAASRSGSQAASLSERHPAALYPPAPPHRKPAVSAAALAAKSPYQLLSPALS